MTTAPEMRPELAADLSRIVDCLTCADGGPEYVRLRALLAELDSRSARGDIAAARLCAIVTQFARLCDVAQRPSP